MSRHGFCFIEQIPKRRDDRHAVLATFLHLLSWDSQNVVLDPLPPDRGNFTWTEHRAKRPQKDDLHPARSVGDDAHGRGKFLPVNRRHRSYFGRRVDAVQSFDGIVLDEACGYRKVEDFTASHDDALQGHLSVGLEERLDDVNDERRGYLIDLFVLDMA